MNYAEALDYINGINATFCNPGTERVNALCHAMGDAHQKLPCIHVAGTNGKGSACAMLESVLLAAGYRVGLFSSPAIHDFNDQIRVMGKGISEDDLAALAREAKRHTDRMQDKPTSFELLTALAFAHFYNQNCDIVILETGLGGRLDATNIVENTKLAIITGIALDHTSFLGDTVAAIAKEKAGIIKPQAPVLFGGEDAEARAVVETVAKQKNAPFYQVHTENIRNIRLSLQETRFDFDNYENLALSLLGSYQPKNAATVITAVGILNRNGIAVSENALRQGLASTVWHARFEKLSENPLVIFDGAHNPQGIGEAVCSIKTYFPGKKILLLTGVLRDKDYREIAHALATVAEHAYTVTPNSPRALRAEEYARTLTEAGLSATPCTTFEQAVASALAHAKETNIPLVCLGSLYLYSSLAPLLKSGK